VKSKTVLIEHPEVRTAAVTWFEIEPGNRGHRSRVRPESRPHAIAGPISSRGVADRLPAAMMPSRWIALPALPQTPSNKVDRGCHPDAARQGTERSIRSGNPSTLTPTEAKIAAIWEGGCCTSKRWIGIINSWNSAVTHLPWLRMLAGHRAGIRRLPSPCRMRFSGTNPPASSDASRPVPIATSPRTRSQRLGSGPRADRGRAVAVLLRHRFEK